MSRPAFLRARSDLHLATQLHEDPVVERASREVERDSGRTKLRRQLMATSVRLSPTLAPTLHAIIERCKERLAVDAEIEPYVYPSATVNAGVARPEDGRVFVLFSSSILDRFEDDELTFVVGHELAHHVFGHHDIPVGSLIKGSQSAVEPRLALKLFSWSRAAEISADRGGLYCCGSLPAVGRGLFKLASGLRGTKSNLAIEALLAQVEELEASGGAKDEETRADWFSTHPFGPLRLKAAQAFAGSVAIEPGGASLEDLEIQTAELLGLMEPGYIHGKTARDRAMRRVLLAGGMMVAAADGGVSEVEAKTLDEYLGEGTVTDKLSVEALAQDLPDRMRALLEHASMGRRAQVIRDLCLIAMADNHVEAAERAILRQLAVAAKVPAELVDQTLGADLELD